MRLEPQVLGNTWKSILSRSNYQLSILFYLEINGNKFFLAVSWNSIFIDSLRNYSILKIIVNKYKSCRNTRGHAVTSLFIAKTNVEWRCRGDTSANTSWESALKDWSPVVTVTKNSFLIRSALITRNAVDSRLHVLIVAKPRYYLEKISRFIWRIIAPRIYFPVHSRTPVAASRYYFFMHYSLSYIRWIKDK